MNWIKKTLRFGEKILNIENEKLGHELRREQAKKK